MRLISVMTSVLLLTAVAVAQPAPLPVAHKTPDGKTLVVPADHKSKGRVYYTINGRDRQIYVESDAPLEKIKGQSNAVIGYAVVSPKHPGEIVAGEWHLPVRSINTGIELRNEHMASKAWLDADAFPDVIVQIRETKDIKPVKQTPAFTSYSATLVGDLTLHGVTHTVSVPNSTIIVMKESPATQKVAKGDLLAIKSKFSVKLADYGVSHPVIGTKVAGTVDLNVSLFLSSNPPAQQ